MLSCNPTYISMLTAKWMDNGNGIALILLSQIYNNVHSFRSILMCVHLFYVFWLTQGQVYCIYFHIYILLLRWVSFNNYIFVSSVVRYLYHIITTNIANRDCYN